MSVLITIKFQADTVKFRQDLTERADEFGKFSEMGHAAGATHHHWGVGDGFIVVIDEWESAEQFQAFFTDPNLQAFVASTGGDLSVPPEITISEAVSSQDQF
jgi:hypothetical protein